MSQIRFEWDPRKSRANAAKHRVSFEEAATAFADEQAVLIADPDCPDGDDDRFVLLGMSSKSRILVVVHCWREDESVIRIISARRANRREQAEYVSRNSR